MKHATECWILFNSLTVVFDISMASDAYKILGMSQHSHILWAVIDLSKPSFVNPKIVCAKFLEYFLFHKNMSFSF